MAALNATPLQQTGDRAPIPPVPPTADTAKSGILSEMASKAAPNRAVDPATKQRMIAEAAYYRAERRGFAPGHDLDDWYEAEASIEVLSPR